MLVIVKRNYNERKFIDIISTNSMRECLTPEDMMAFNGEDESSVAKKKIVSIEVIREKLDECPNVLQRVYDEWLKENN